MNDFMRSVKHRTQVINILNTKLFKAHVFLYIFCGAPMYADDLALIAFFPEDLQSMIDIVAQYAKKWRYRLNPQQSKVLVFDSIAPPPFTSWSINGEKLEAVKEYLHLGILRSTSPSTLN